MWILIIVKKTNLGSGGQHANNTPETRLWPFCPITCPLTPRSTFWAVCPWRQTDTNKRIDALTSGPKYLFWWPELEKNSHLFIPFPPYFFFKGIFSLQDAGSQDGIGRMSKVPRTTSPCTQLAFSLNAVGAWFSLSIQAGRRRWAPWRAGLGAFETTAETPVNWADVIQLLVPSTRPRLSKIWDGCLCG